MSLKRFSLRTLLGLFTVVAVCLAVFRAHRDWCCDNYPYYYIRPVLATEVHNDDAIEEVAWHFRRHEKVNNEDRLAHLREISRETESPIEEGDEFIDFFLGSRGYVVSLQFRNGKLVNHSNWDYDLRRSRKIPRLDEQPMPSVLELYGGQLMYLFVVGGALLAGRLLRRAADENLPTARLR